MNHLLVCGAYPLLQSTHIGADNLLNLISKGYDLEVHTPSPKSAGQLSMDSLKEFWSITNRFVNKKIFKVKPHSRPEPLFKPQVEYLW